MSYDNERSVALKAEFAYDAGLAGVRSFLLRKKSDEEQDTIFINHHQNILKPSSFTIYYLMVLIGITAAQVMTCSIVFHL